MIFLRLLLAFLLLCGTANATVNEVNAREDYVGNSSATIYAYGFKINFNTDIEVLVNNVVQTLNTHYTVTGVGNAAGGTIVFGTAPASPLAVTIIRKQPLQQSSNYVAQEQFPAERVEADLDKLAMIAQMLKEIHRRSLTFDKSSTKKDITLPAPASNTYLKWNAAASDLENADPLVLSGSLLNLSTALNSYTKALLPAAGIAGRMARVTDDTGGLYLDSGSFWAPILGGKTVVHDVTCDGATDDVATIQTIIDRVSTRGGGVVELLPCHHRINSTLNMKSNVILQGMGYTTQISIPTGSVFHMITVGAGVANWTIRDMRLTGGGNAAGINNGVHINTASKGVVDNLTIANMDAVPIYCLDCNDIVITKNRTTNLTAQSTGIQICGGRQVSIVGNQVTDGDFGITVTGVGSDTACSRQSNSVDVVGNTALAQTGATGTGFNVNDGIHVTFVGNTSDSPGAYCFQLKNATGDDTKMNVYSSNTCVSPVVHGFYVQDGSYGLFVNNTIFNAGSHCIYVNSAPRIRIMNNIISTCAGHGVHIAGAATSESTSAFVTGNIITGVAATFSLVSISNTSGVRVDGNELALGVALNHILIDATSVDVYIGANNRITGTFTVSDASLRTNYAYTRWSNAIDLSVGTTHYLDYFHTGFLIGKVTVVVTTTVGGVPTLLVGKPTDTDYHTTSTVLAGTAPVIQEMTITGAGGRQVDVPGFLTATVGVTGTGIIRLKIQGIIRQ